MSVLTLPQPSNPAMPANASPLLTAEEFFAKHENRRAELIHGIVKELPMPDFDHGHLCGLMTYFLTEFARQHNLGRVMSNDSFIRVRRNPDTVLGADVWCVLWKGSHPQQELTLPGQLGRSSR